MRRTVLQRLSHRPKTQKVEPGSNRLLEEPHFAKAKEIFAAPSFPNKRVIHNWRFFIRAGKAATGPPVGQEFSKLGLKVMDFTKSFNDRTKPVFKDDVDVICRIQVFFDKSYNYRIEPPPTVWFLLRAVRKRRRDCVPTHIRGCWSCYITLEMIYEIAKIKQFRWTTPEYPMIEHRVRSIVSQARAMGICVLGVDAPSSPVKGITADDYQKKSEEYRQIHRQQYEEMSQKQLEDAPLIERLHRPGMGGLDTETLEKGMAQPDVLGDVWRATNPHSPYLHDLKKREVALKAVRSRKWEKDLSYDEAKEFFFNWRLPKIERERQMSKPQQSYWGRDQIASAQPPK